MDAWVDRCQDGCLDVWVDRRSKEEREKEMKKGRMLGSTNDGD